MITFDNITIHFGQTGGKDYMIDNIESDKQRYLQTHSNDDWSLRGIRNSSFWRRWILWSELTMNKTLRKIQGYI